MQTITGAEAIDKIREFKLMQGKTFGIVFITCNLSTHKKSGERRKYERCRLRTAQRSEGLAVNSDHYLYFTDCDSDEPKQCFKKLIRLVMFDGIWYNVEWFK